MAIKFYIDEQTIELKTDKNIASDSINFVELEFVFCNSWTGYNKTIQFTQRTNTYSVNLGTNGTTCFLPNEITDGLCAISVFGNKNNAKRATTVPLNVRIKRSGFIEDGIIPSDTPLTVIEQLIQDNENLKVDVDGLKDDVKNLKSSMAAVSRTISQNRLVPCFDYEFGKGRHSSGIDVYYDKTTNELTLNGTATEEVIIGRTGDFKNATTFLNLGCYEFVNCKFKNIFDPESSFTSLPFKLALSTWIDEGLFINDNVKVTDRETAAAAEPGTYNILKRDCYVGMSIIIPAGSSFDNEVFYPWLLRYSACIE